MYGNNPCAMLEMIHFCRRRSLGFTLVELMVTLALLAILLLFAVPSFQEFRRSSELSTAANGLVAVLSVARGEAMKRSATTLVIPATGTDWSSGYLAFVDTNYDASYTAATDILLARNNAALPPYLVVTQTGTAGYVRFNGSGYSVTGAGFGDSTLEIARTDLTGTDLLAQTRRIKVNPSGRLRVCTPKSTIDATCLATGG